MGDVFEYKAQLMQAVAGSFRRSFFVWKQALQDAPVFAQRIVYVTNIIICAAFCLVVKTVSAVVVTELLVGPPFHRFSTAKAGP